MKTYLEQLVELKGSRKEAAKAMGVSERQFYRWQNDDTPMSESRRVHLAFLLGIRPESLVD